MMGLVSKYFNNLQGKDVLRIGVGLIVLWFGVDHIINVDYWATYVKPWMEIGFVTKEVATYSIAVIDIVIGLLLLLRKYVWVVALFLFIQMVGIVIVLTGFDATGMRDLVLAVAALTLVIDYKKN